MMELQKQQGIFNIVKFNSCWARWYFKFLGRYWKISDIFSNNDMYFDIYTATKQQVTNFLQEAYFIHYWGDINNVINANLRDSQKSYTYMLKRVYLMSKEDWDIVQKKKLIEKLKR